MNLLSKGKMIKKLVTLQRQVVIKILVKKDKDKRLISIWRPVSLLNVDYKTLPKIFASRLKKVPPNLISSQQTAYLAQRCIDESRRLISDFIAIYMVNAFDSLDHTFLISALKNLLFGKTFID